MAGGLGFEPRLTESESNVDPNWREEAEDRKRAFPWPTEPLSPTDPRPNSKPENRRISSSYPTRSTAYQLCHLPRPEPLAKLRDANGGAPLGRTTSGLLPPGRPRLVKYDQQQQCARFRVRQRAGHYLSMSAWNHRRSRSTSADAVRIACCRPGRVHTPGAMRPTCLHAGPAALRWKLRHARPPCHGTGAPVPASCT